MRIVDDKLDRIDPLGRAIRSPAAPTNKRGQLAAQVIGDGFVEAHPHDAALVLSQAEPIITADRHVHAPADQPAGTVRARQAPKLLRALRGLRWRSVAGGRSRWAHADRSAHISPSARQGGLAILTEAPEGGVVRTAARRCSIMSRKLCRLPSAAPGTLCPRFGPPAGTWCPSRRSGPCAARRRRAVTRERTASNADRIWGQSNVASPSSLDTFTAPGSIMDTPALVSRARLSAYAGCSRNTALTHGTATTEPSCTAARCASRARACRCCPPPTY